MVEECLERRQFLFRLLLTLERERRSVKYRLFNIERRIFPKRQGNGVARPGVLGDESSSLGKNQVREEHLPLRSVNHHGIDARIQIGERI